MKPFLTQFSLTAAQLSTIQWTHKKSRCSSPVDHRSLDDLCTSTYTMSQKLCARYTLGARYLYFKRNVENLGCALYVRCTLSVGKYGNYDCSSFITLCFQVHQPINSDKSRTADSSEKHCSGNIPSLTVHNFWSARHRKNRDCCGSNFAGKVCVQYIATSSVHTLESHGILYSVNVECE